MRAKRLLLVVFMVAGLLAPLRGNAAVRSECTGQHSGGFNSAECLLFLAGPSLFVTTKSSSYVAAVALIDVTGNVSLLSCYSFESPGANCTASAGFGVTGGVVDLPAGVPLRCIAFMGGPGSFSCSTSLL